MSTQPIASIENIITPDELLRLNALATDVDIDSITVGERIRRDFSHVPALAESIRENGLIQPIVLTHDRRLIAGESRIRAHKALGLKSIRAVFRGVLDEAQLHILECEENNARQNLTWQERCLSVDRVHRYKNVEAALRGQKWGVRETGDLLKQGKSDIGLAVFVATALHEENKDVWAAESMTDAYRVLIKQREEEAVKLLVKNSGAPVPCATPKTPGAATVGAKIEIPPADFFSNDPTVTAFFTPGVAGGADAPVEDPGDPSAGPLTIPLSRMLLRNTHGHNSLQTMSDLGPDCCDHIITDPPYGIDMDNFKQDQGGQDVSGVAAEHDVDQNVALLDAFITKAYDALRDKGFLIMWCDPTMWQALCDQCSLSGFRVQRWPLVWNKTSACSNQSASTNFTKTIEFAVVARKGNATLLSQQPSCVYTGGNDAETRLLGHPFAKPAGLWTWLYKAICQRGQTVLDPFVGCGSSTLPAVKYGLNPIGIECNEVHYGRLLVNTQNLYKSIDTNVQFT